MLREVGIEVRVTEITQNKLVAPEFVHIVLVLATFALAKFRLRVAAVVAWCHSALDQRCGADWAVHVKNDL